MLLAILFYMHFSGSSNEPGVEPVQEASADKFMYYVNTDSIWENYELRKQLDQQLVEKKAQYQREIETRIRSLQDDYESLQAQAQTMGKIQLQVAQNNLLKKEESIAKYRESLEIKLMEEEQQFRQDLREKIVSYIKENTGNLDYDYIMGYSGSGPLLLANDSLNLTESIVDGLNAELDKQELQE